MRLLMVLLLLLLALPPALGVRKPSLHNTVAAMFSAAPPPCRQLNIVHQAAVCRNPGLAAALQQAHQLARSQCREHFRYDLWNCSTTLGAGSSVFNEVYRETAVMYAVAAAAIAHTVARACAQGSLRSCECEPGDCGESSVRYGRKFARRFLQLAQTGRALNEAVLRHDSELGLQVVWEQMQLQALQCQCHGLSGSCTARTCWRRRAPFESVVAALKRRYNQAAWLPSGNEASPPPLRQARGQLLFLQPTPGLCAASRGRQCLQAYNCATVCCGRGYRHQLVRNMQYCRCRWEAGLRLHCDTCSSLKEVHTCK